MNDTSHALQGQVALVTGSASGIGAAIAIAFARAGARVCINYASNREGAEKTAAAIGETAGDALVLQADVGSETAVEAMFAAAKRTFGTPTILVNNAGIDALGKPIADMSLAEWEAALRTNLTGPFLCARAFVRGVAQAGAGGAKMINISSVHEEIPRAGASEYCASKGGLRNLTRCLSLELAPQKINVNAIAPGMILTPMNQADLDDPEKLKKDEETIPWRRGGQPEEVARLALYLASRDADYVTGATYVIDGGLMQNQGQGA
ncbi:MAG: glucose 1-dehydrogenase [Candidatus Eremiobacteraeota bacterium]|nr:glucose 1-dehydrogenase [Candidatus Eremiobacteraeota bacterium]MBC5803714.1 glucose 1-dehydrogenase [Candidatus Eremiobacteraeota bacterium]MBC5820807.1 glucose 1-dehydrogenase [Candidatus Eremiobacteraeota bacterium]